MKQSHRITITHSIDKYTTVVVSGIAYKHEDAHVDENPIFDTSVTVDIDSIKYNGTEVLGLLQATSEDAVEECKDELLRAGWAHYRGVQELQAVNY